MCWEDVLRTLVVFQDGGLPTNTIPNRCKIGIFGKRKTARVMSDDL